jgi:hypothetical protein
MMKRLIAIAVFLLLSGCQSSPSDIQPTDRSGVTIWHDDERAVTCWIYTESYKGGISCLPDSMVRDTR